MAGTEPDEVWRSGRVQAAAAKVADAVGGADIILYSGGIYAPSDDEMMGLTNKHGACQNAVLMLTTDGGSPDVAFRLARCLQARYTGKLIVLVNTVCKSAGSLVAVGADEIVMSDGAQLGPLDMQLVSRDEVGEYGSGLTPIQTLATLRSESLKLFQEHFERLRFRRGFSFPTKMAASIATRMTIGLLKPVYEQIDPMRLGENQRAMMIAAEYGERLDSRSRNLRDRALAKLVSSYPSHGFVVDRAEAQELFHRVRSANDEELALVDSLCALVEEGQRRDYNGEPAVIEYIFANRTPKVADGVESGAGDEQTAGADRSGAPAVRSDGEPAFGNGRAESNGSVGAAIVGSRPASRSDGTA